MLSSSEYRRGASDSDPSPTRVPRDSAGDILGCVRQALPCNPVLPRATKFLPLEALLPASSRVPPCVYEQSALRVPPCACPALRKRRCNPAFRAARRWPWAPCVIFQRNDRLVVAETASKMAVAAVLATTAEGFAPTLRTPAIPSFSKGPQVLLFSSLSIRSFIRRVHVCVCISQASFSRAALCRCACRRPACAQLLPRRWATSRTWPSRSKTSES